MRTYPCWCQDCKQPHTVQALSLSTGRVTEKGETICRCEPCKVRFSADLASGRRVKGPHNLRGIVYVNN